MNAQEFADALDGREYGDEISAVERRIAEKNDLLVIFGYSDDTVELNGIMEEDVVAYTGTTLLLHRGGVITRDHACNCEFCDYENIAEKCVKVKAVWRNDGTYSWTFKTEIPHAAFDIWEDGDKFCRGIVISGSDLPRLA